MLVDVGAHHGGSISQFCESGWTVHAFEPDPSNRKILKKNVKSSWDLTINDKAVAETDGETVDFFASSESTGVSGLSPFLDSHERVAQVETIRLSTYLAAKNITHVDYLKVDTEGHDLFVLKSYPWDHDSPDAIECEFEDNKTVALGYTSDELAEFLIDKGYEVMISEWHPIVQYGISHDFLTLRRYEPGSISGHAWGNFLAVRTPEALDDLAEHARRRGVDIRERSDRHVVEVGVNTYPPEFPDSPSAIPRMVGMGTEPDTLSSSEMDIAAMALSPKRLVKRFIDFYLAPTGMLLLAAFALMAIGLIGFDYSWVPGVLGIALLGVFLPYKLVKIDQRQFEQSNALQERVRAARLAADSSRSAVNQVQDELRRSVDRLDKRINDLE